MTARKGLALTMSIHKAIERGDLKKVKELLAAGAPVDERNRGGQTPLMIAVMHNLTPYFKALLMAGADVNAVDAVGESVMHYAGTHGTPLIVQALLEKEPDLNVRNRQGEPPLMGALTAQVVELLLEAGADPDARRNDGLTLLDLCETYRKNQGGLKESKIEQLLRAASAARKPKRRN